MGQVGFRVASSPWEERMGAEKVCWASNKVPNGKYAVWGMWLHLWVPGITSLNYSLNKSKVSVEINPLWEKLSILIREKKVKLKKKKKKA